MDEPAFRQFAERVAKLGYMAGRGARCPDCRNRDSMEALGHCPRDWPEDPVERMAYEYEHYGRVRPLPTGRWGKAYADALVRRGRRFDTYAYAEGGWQNGPQPTVEGVSVWRFTVPGAPNQPSAYVPDRPPPQPIVVLNLAADGRSAIITTTFPGRFALRPKRKETVAWHPGLVFSAPPEYAHEPMLVSALVPERAAYRGSLGEDAIGHEVTEPAQIYTVLRYGALS